MKNIFEINGIEFGGKQLPIIAGPCVIESRDHILHMAEKIKEITDKIKLPLIFKSSFDKGNRSSHSSFRGPGIDTGLRILEEVKQTFNISVTTDIHNASQAEAVSEIVDIIQIPAFLCRQSDIINAAVKTGKIINVKKGQFMAPWDVKNIVAKVADGNGEKLLLTER